MPHQQRIRTGDGVNTVLVDAVLSLPDSGHSVSIAGTVQAPGQAAQVITGSPLTWPSNPGAGSIFVQLVIDWTSGAASVQQNTTAYGAAPDEGPKGLPLLLSMDMPALQNVKAGTLPAAADASTSVIVFQQTLTSTSPTALWQNTTSQVIEQY